MKNKNIKYDDEEDEGEVTRVIQNGTPYFDLIGLTFISGMSLKKVAQLYIMLNIKTVEELYEACKEGRVSELKGWGLKMQNKIKNEIELSILFLTGNISKVEKEVNSPKKEKNLVDRDFLLNLALRQRDDL
jgi:hypothetical protein